MIKINYWLCNVAALLLALAALCQSLQILWMAWSSDVTAKITTANPNNHEMEASWVRLLIIVGFTLALDVWRGRIATQNEGAR